VKPRNTLIVVAVLAALLAYLYWVELPQTPEQLSARQGTPTATPASYMFQLKASDVQTIVITDLRFPRVVALQRTDSGWRVTQPVDKPADLNKADATANALTNLQIMRVLNVTDLAPYGLAPAWLEARVIMKDGTAYGLLLGSTTPDSSLYYVTYTGDKSKVFLIETSLGLSLHSLLDTPPFEPTATPMPTVTPLVTPTVEGTSLPPGFVPTLLPTPAATAKP
jgi:hypothetical protein